MRKIGVALFVALMVIPAPAMADHEYDDGCWEGECYDGGGGGQNYEDQWSNEDRNRNRNRNRGAFSPGPFDDSPVTIIICPPGTQYCGSDGGRTDEGEPA
jgi:hypothetical protein